MPDVKVYIREENMEKWKAIPKKADWINTLLANSDDTSRYGKAENSPVGPVVPVLSEVVPSGELCKHGADPDFCKFAKPGKRCK